MFDHPKGRFNQKAISQQAVPSSNNYGRQWESLENTVLMCLKAKSSDGQKPGANL